jgi:hypothetical protein
LVGTHIKNAENAVIAGNAENIGLPRSGGVSGITKWRFLFSLAQKSKKGTMVAGANNAI